MTLLRSNGNPFACGAVTFDYRPATDSDRTNRIIIPIEIESISTYAVVDTGAPYIVCAPEIAFQINLSAESSLGSVQIGIRGHDVHGHLHRLTLRLVAEDGESIDIDATAFVPVADEWPGDLPSFFGLNECMDRMHVAIDPEHEMFHFGPLD